MCKKHTYTKIIDLRNNVQYKIIYYIQLPRIDFFN